MVRACSVANNLEVFGHEKFCGVNYFNVRGRAAKMREIYPHLMSLLGKRTDTCYFLEVSTRSIDKLAGY